MRRFRKTTVVTAGLMVMFIIAACGKEKKTDGNANNNAEPAKVETNLRFESKFMKAVKENTGTKAEGAPQPFLLVWSEYPSWSVFGVCDELKLINGKKGELGDIEKKYNVDIVLKQTDYDTSIGIYSAGECDAVCITNMDILAPSLSIDSVAIMPTSTSDGADAVLVTSAIKGVKGLKGKKVYGLEKSVSEYCFVRNLEIAGEKESDYTFQNMDPAAAAQAMQGKQAGFDAIVVWNPFVISTLEQRDDVRVLFDSTKIKGEIIDMVVMSQKSLDKPGGAQAAMAIADAFYQLNVKMNDPKSRDDVLIALGAKFSNLGVDKMKIVVKQTKFYGTADEGIEVFTAEATKGIMKKVVQFCVDHEIVDKAPGISFKSKYEK